MTQAGDWRGLTKIITRVTDQRDDARKKLKQAIKHIDDMTSSLIAGDGPINPLPASLHDGFADTPPQDDFPATPLGVVMADGADVERDVKREVSRLREEDRRKLVVKAAANALSKAKARITAGMCLCGAEGRPHAPASIPCCIQNTVEPCGPVVTEPTASAESTVTVSQVAAEMDANATACTSGWTKHPPGWSFRERF